MTSPRYRIGLDCREAFRETPRGVGQYTRDLMGEFCARDRGLDYAFYHERDIPTGLPSMPKWARAHRVEMRGSRFHSWERIAMPMRLRSDGIDLYHGTYNTLPPRLPLTRKPKMVVTLHDILVTWWNDDHDDPFVRYARKVTPRVVRQADAIITISEFSRGDIVKRFDVDPSKVRVIHNGVSQLFRENPPPETALQARAKFARGLPYLYAIGAKLRRKNTDALFPMFRRLKEQGVLQNEVLVVTGLAGTALDERRAAAKAAGVADSVELLGYQSREDLRALYTGAELFLYPSLVEGWGLPVVEALACGTPVAASNRTAIPEAGGDDARYFDPENLDSICETVAQALHDRSEFADRKDEMTERARGFTWKQCAEQVLELYEELLEARVGASS